MNRIEEENTTPALAILREEIVGCRRCPRLVEYREMVARTRKRAFIDQEYWGKPLPSFGDPNARVMIIGLAPAAHGSNRTGRMFTGDGTDGMGGGDFLMRALYNTGFASQPRSRHPGDGLTLHDLYIAAAVRCAPPGNKPLPEEIANCRPYLFRELDLLPNLRVMVALGKIGFDTVLAILAERGAAIPKPKPRFAHGALLDLGERYPLVLASYHPSRQNTQTRLLSPAMLEDIFRRARELADRRAR